jgi:16S rRNA (cytidine1402-2'-O)-methyltransferase
MTGTLYICATPIGNLEDITYRVLNCLKTVDLIAAEDTRNSMKLLTHFDIHTPMTAYHEFNKYDKAKALVHDLLEGKNIAIITDAGTPCISDPGEELVRQAAEAGIPITSLPGAVAAVTALTISALPTRRFAFEAFLPHEKADKRERNRILEELRSETRTMILYESPHHLKATLRDLCDTLGSNRPISLCRELTKKHEEAFRTTLGEALAHYEQEDPRGEYVLVIAGKSPEALAEESQESWNAMPLADHMQHYLDQGMPEKDAMKQVAKDRGVSKRDIYNEWKVKN